MRPSLTCRHAFLIQDSDVHCQEAVSVIGVHPVKTHQKQIIVIHYHLCLKSKGAGGSFWKLQGPLAEIWCSELSVTKLCRPDALKMDCSDCAIASQRNQ